MAAMTAKEARILIDVEVELEKVKWWWRWWAVGIKRM
jgi:hypothetical protein